MSRIFGTVHQIGYVVKDIEKAMAHWSSKLGVGPWFYKEDTGMSEFTYYGKPSEFPKLSIALAQSGELQIELIQQRNDAPSLYLDSLKKNGEIAQHIAYATMDDFDKWRKHFLEQGYQEGHAGRMGPNRGRFAYFVHPELPSGMFELSELRGGKAEYFDKVRRASVNWDGQDPVRLPSGA
jgi:hypothetical protein